MARAGRDTRARTSVSPAAHTVLPTTTLWRSCRTLPGLWVPPFLGKEEIRAPVPIPRSQTSLQGRLSPSSIGLPSLEVTKASASPTPTSQYPGPILRPLWGWRVFVEGPLFEPARWGGAALKPGFHLEPQCQVAKPLPAGLLGLPPTQLLPWELDIHLQSLPPLQGSLELQGRGETVWERSVWASDSWGHGKTKDIGLGAMLGWMRPNLGYSL